MAIDIHSTEPCPRCGGSGKKVSISALKALLEKSAKTQREVAEAMHISQQFLCDLLRERRDWSPKLLLKFRAAIGLQEED